MEKFNWSKAIGFGALIWAIVFAFVSFLVGMNFYDSWISKTIIVLLIAVLSYICAANVKSVSATQAFGYGFWWVVVGMVLDALISIRFNPDMFIATEYWIGYVLLFLIPVIYFELMGTKSEKRDMSHAG